MLVLIQKAFAKQTHYLGNYVSYIAIQAVAQLLTLFYLHTAYSGERDHAFRRIVIMDSE